MREPAFESDGVVEEDLFVRPPRRLSFDDCDGEWEPVGPMEEAAIIFRWIILGASSGAVIYWFGRLALS